MAEIKAGKFTISPQSGVAGTHQIVHKLNDPHTGRNPYTRTIKASIKENSNIYAIETLTIIGAPLKVAFTENEKHVAYDSTEVVFNCTTNAYGLYIEPESYVSGGIIEGIKQHGAYNIYKEGNKYKLIMSDSETGSQSEVTFSIIFKLLQNTSTESTDYYLRVHALNEDESTTDVSTAIKITQDSSDNSIQAWFDPEEWSEVGKNGETFTIDVFSNSTAYEVYEDVSWIDISASTPTGSGSNYTSKVTITVSPQNVASLRREGTIYLKSKVTGSILATFIVTQEAGDNYSVTWSLNGVEFAPNDYSLGTTKINTLTANSNWDITETV